MPLPHRVETEMTELERSQRVEIKRLDCMLDLARQANKRLNVEWSRQRDEIRDSDPAICESDPGDA